MGGGAGAVLGDKAVLDEEEVAAVGSVRDQQLLASRDGDGAGARRRRGDGVAARRQFHRAGCGCTAAAAAAAAARGGSRVVEIVDIGAQRHAVVGPGCRIVQRAGVDGAPGPAEAGLIEGGLGLAGGGPVSGEAGLHGGEEPPGAGRQKRAGCGRPVQRQ